MTKPIFGKWTRVEDGLPEFETQAGGIEFVFVLAQYKDGRVMETERNSKDGWRAVGMGVSHEIVAWMPKPKYNEDAFTELRALLDELEIIADSHEALDIIDKVREVIE